MKYLKKRNNSDALYYQRRISKHLVAKATEFNLSNPITRPLNLKASKATDVQIATKLEQRNREFEDLMRLVEGTDLQAMSNAEWETTARAYLDARGLKGGTLRGVEFSSDEFEYRAEEALGIHVNQDHPDWELNYPNERKLPDQLVSAINSVLNTRAGSKRFHLFSDAADHYKTYRRTQVDRLDGTEAEKQRKRNELKKDFKRLDDFLISAGNQEFTQQNVNEALREYRNYLVAQHSNPNTAKRHLNVPAAAMTKYADDVATNVVVTKLKIDGQARAKNVRPVLDLERELPLVWAAAHSEEYGQFERLSIFGIFSGATASEIVQTLVEDVYLEDDYYILGGTKQNPRRRPVVIINETHRQLLMQNVSGYVVGENVAMQSTTSHSKRLKKCLQRATGNDQLTHYSCRHTGKHLAETKGVGHLDVMRTMFGWTKGAKEAMDNYGRAGIFSKTYIAEIKRITDLMLEDLPKYDDPAPSAARNPSKEPTVLKLKRSNKRPIKLVK